MIQNIQNLTCKGTLSPCVCRTVWGPCRTVWGTAVMDVSEIIGLYNVKTILTDNSVQKLRNQKLNKTKCDSDRLKTPWGGFSGGLSANEWKYLNERDHKIYTASQNMGGQVIFFSYMESGHGGIFWPWLEKIGTVEHPERVVSFRKEIERGWKSGVTSLSWKSGWKPWTIREFWHQCI